MKDFQDLLQKNNLVDKDKIDKDKADLMMQFENMQKELRNIQNTQVGKSGDKSSKNLDDDADDYDDELQDQMAESLFEEANQMGIFKMENLMGGVDYAAALQKVEKEVEK